MMATNNVADSPRLSGRLKAGWGLGSAATQIVLFSQSLLLLYFFTAILGLQPALVGTLLFVGKLFDAFLSPVVGSWSDRAHTRWGRRRPFLVAGGVACGIGLIFIFNPPSANPAVLLGGLMVISVGYSMFNIPYLAMAAEMTDSPLERTSIMTWRIAFVGIGTVVSTALLPLIAKSGGGGRAGYGLAGWIAGGLVFIIMLVTFAITARARSTQSTGESFSFPKMISAVTGNRPFGYLLIAKLLQLIGLAATSASVLFFFKTVIGGDEGMLALWGLTSNLISILSMFLWSPLAARFGKVAVYGLSVTGYSLFGFSWLLAGPDSTIVTVLLRAGGAGFFTGGLLLMGQSLLADTIAYDYSRTGLRREGIFAGAYSFVEKASSALGPMLVGFIFQIMGFATHGGATSSDNTAVYIAVGVLPPAAYLISVLPLLGIRMTLRQPKAEMSVV